MEGTSWRPRYSSQHTRSETAGSGLHELRGSHIYDRIGVRPTGPLTTGEDDAMTNSSARAPRPWVIPVALWTAIVLTWIMQSLLVALDPGPCGQASCTGSLTAHDPAGYLIASVVPVVGLCLIVWRIRSAGAVPAGVASDYLVDRSGSMSTGRLHLFLLPSPTAGQGGNETQTDA